MTPDRDDAIFVGKGGKPEYLTLALANRHGLVTGATGTGKTVTLQVLAEGLVARRRLGLRRRHQGRSVRHRGRRRGQGGPRHARQGAGLRLRARPNFRSCSGTCSASRAIPMRATISEMGPLLLSRLMDLNDVAGRRAQHRLPRRRRAGPAAARPEGSARHARLSGRARRPS